jgi:polyisoprenoid-binding protein YceI
MTRRPASDASRRRPIFFAAAVVIVLAVAAAAYGVWYLFLQPAGPRSVAESTLPPVPSAPAATGASPSGSTGAGPSASAVAAGGIDGTWKVDTTIGSFSDFSGTFVGYRVQEELGSIGANTAVGRTPDVTGSLTIAGTQVTAATFTADLTTLQSDDDRRDGQLRRQGLETGTYPTGSFTLTSPIDLGGVPTDGKEIAVTAKGKLTLHGQTNDVELPVKARLSNGVITASGSLPIVFADYGIPKPQSFAVLSIADEGTMELQLFFTRG